MAKGKDGLGKNGPKAGGTQGTPGSSPKKPSQIIDLKATEIKDQESAKQSKSSLEDSIKSQDNTPQTKTAGTSDKATDKQSGKADLDKRPVQSSVPAAGGSAGTKGKDKNKAAASNTKQDKSKSAPDSAKAAKSADTQKKTPVKTLEKAQDTGAAQNARQTRKKNSGGGITWMFTHIIASALGGILVLYGARHVELGAQYIEKEFGIDIRPSVEIPSAIEARLAALEKRPTIEPAAIRNELGGQIDTLKRQLGGLDQVRQEVKELAARPQPAIPETAKAGQSEDIENLTQRLATLEATLDSLASATNADGQPTSLAGLTSLSGKVRDLESSLNIEIAELRTNVTENLEKQVSEIAEVSAAAQAGTRRIDKQLAQLQSTISQLEQSSVTSRAARTRIDENARVVRDETAKLRDDLDSLTGNVKQNFKSVMRRKDLENAVSPVAESVAALQSQLTNIVANERNRQANTQRVIVASEWRNLKHIINLGNSYKRELHAVKNEVKKIDGLSVDFSNLEKFQDRGVQDFGALQKTFTKLAYDVIKAAKTGQASENAQNANMMGRVWSVFGGVTSVIRVRNTNFDEADMSVEAIVSRIEKALKKNDVARAMTEIGTLPKEALEPIKTWKSDIEARIKVDEAIAGIEKQLTSSFFATTGKKG